MVCLVAAVLLGLIASPAGAYFLIKSDVTPKTVKAGQTVNISYTVGDLFVPSHNHGPYRVEIYYCNASTSQSCFTCGKDSLIYPEIPNRGEWDYNWESNPGSGYEDKDTHFDCKGTVQGFIGSAAHDGAVCNTTFTMPWKIPANLPVGKYKIHILVGYDKTACNNGTHYLQTIDVTCPQHPAIKIDKSGPSTASVGDTVRYEYKVSNVGDCDLTSISVNDDIAGAAAYVSGDSDGDSWLDLTEQWLYKADYTIPADCANPLVNKGTATGYDNLGLKVTDDDTHSLNIVCVPVPGQLTSQITDTDGNDLETMLFKCENTKTISTNPGGLMYWVRWNTGSYSGPATIKINSILPSNDFVLWSENPVKVDINGITVYVGKNLIWTGYVPKFSSVVVRVHYKYARFGVCCNMIKPKYTFSADVNSMKTSDILLTSIDHGPGCKTYADQLEREARARRLQEAQETQARRLREAREAQARRMQENQRALEERARRIQEMQEAQARRIREMQEAQARRIREMQEAQARRIREMQEAQARRIREMQEAQARRLEEMRRRQGGCNR